MEFFSTKTKLWNALFYINRLGHRIFNQVRSQLRMIRISTKTLIIAPQLNNAIISDTRGRVGPIRKLVDRWRCLILPIPLICSTVLTRRTNETEWETIFFGFENPTGSEVIDPMSSPRLCRHRLYSDIFRFRYGAYRSLSNSWTRSTVVLLGDFLKKEFSFYQSVIQMSVHLEHVLFAFKSK